MISFRFGWSVRQILPWANAGEEDLVGMATMIEENGPSTHIQEQPDVSSSSQARQKLEGLLNKNMRIRMTDGRTLVGLFLCTDRDCNVILGSAQEFLKSTDTFSQGEPRVLGLAMIPGHHVVSIEVEADSLDDAQGFGVNH